jgi:membrane-bound inhibitor of C-type lysozyme
MMKKTWKHMFALALTVVLTAGSTLCASAEEYSSGDDWNVTYTGSKVESNFSSDSIAEAMSKIESGDSTTFKVTLKNADSNSTNWYMANEVLATLENSRSASGAAYTYTLTYTNPSGADTVLFTSDRVGGEKSTGVNNGLKEATESLSGFFYLDTLDAGQTAKVTLKVTLNGETTGNRYQDTMARIQMKFGVEKVKKVAARNSLTTTETTNTTTVTTLTPGSQATTLKPIQTGDHSAILLWSLLAMGSGILILIIAIWRFRKERSERGQMQS